MSQSSPLFSRTNAAAGITLNSSGQQTAISSAVDSTAQDAIKGALRVRIVSLDAYQARPIAPTHPSDTRCDDTASLIHPDVALRRVPVIRIFGATESGQKVCLHNHRIYPYIYLPYDQSLDPDAVASYTQRLALSINEALSIALGRPRDPSQCQFVYGIVLVRAIPFYGYHRNHAPMLKIYMLDSNVMRRLVELLQFGSIMGQKFQPYEHHIPYLLQFLMDFNLYGMNFICLSDALFRLPIQERLRRWSEDARQLQLTSDNLSPLKQWPVHNAPKRNTLCELEMDVWPWDIQNRLEIEERASEPNAPVHCRIEKLVHSLQALWEAIN